MTLPSGARTASTRFVRELYLRPTLFALLSPQSAPRISNLRGLNRPRRFESHPLRHLFSTTYKPVVPFLYPSSISALAFVPQFEGLRLAITYLTTPPFLGYYRVMEQQEPKTLQQAMVYFSSPDNCREYMVARRWPKGVACPRCGSDKVKFQPKYNRWQCNAHHPRRQFTIKTGTIFEESPLGMDKWLAAVWLIVNCKNGVSSYEIHRALGVTQKTAWFMLHRIRLGMQSRPFAASMSGEVEADETFIGGKARNMHKDKHAEKIQGRGSKGKVIVMGLLERHGKVHATVVPTRRKGDVQSEVRKHVAPGSTVYTDELLSYDGLQSDYAHKVINHAEEYVRGNVHTNGMENFWSLLKRGLGGTYVSVEPFHLFRYLDEQAWRYNNRRNMSDSDRFELAMSQVVGKRVTYDQLTGKVGQTAA